MKKHKNKNNSGCNWMLWVIAVLVIWCVYSSNHKENNSARNSSGSNNTIRNSAVSATAKPLSTTSTKNVAARQTSTPVPTPIYIIYNPKDLNGAPFYSKPNNVQDFWIRSLGNETKIEIIGEMESRNNFDWFPIRDDRGREGWVQAIYVSDSRHVNLKPSDINKSVPSKTPLPTRTPVPARKPTSAPFIKTWTCYDVTSIDYNWDNDNKCVSNSNEVRYVGDSEAMRLDPSYRPR